MRTIYVDSKHHCHVINDGTMTAVETDIFDGKCDDYIEGHCYEIQENAIAVYMWKPYSELDAAQRTYERQLIVELQKNSVPIAELEAAYQEGVNSV